MKNIKTAATDQKVKIHFGKARVKKNTVISPDILYYCGIGDGVHDGLYTHGSTLEEAALNFVKKYNRSKVFNFTDK